MMKDMLLPLQDTLAKRKPLLITMAAGLVPEDGDPAIREALHAYIDYVAGRIV